MGMDSKPSKLYRIRIHEQIGWSIWFNVYSYLHEVSLPPWWIKNLEGSMDEARINFWQVRWAKRPHFGEWFNCSSTQEFLNHTSNFHQIQVFGHAMQTMWNWQKGWVVGVSHSDKLDSEFSIFVSTFYSVILTTPIWKIPSLDAFTKSLI